MNRKLVSKAISNIYDAFIAENLSPPGAARDRAPERTIQMSKYESKKTETSSRRLFALVLAACLVFAMALTAYACNLFGIRDFLTKLPETAEPYIQEHTETKAAEDWSATITESLCDETKVMVTVTVSGGDKYIIAPTDADPDSLAVNIGIEGNMTLGEYAAQQGKQLLFFGASLEQNDSLGGVGSQSFRNVSDNEMTILITAEKNVALTENDIVCHVYAVDEEWNKLTLDIPFSLAEAPSEGLGTYVPVNADAIPGMIIGEATITETPLGLSIRYMETATDEEAMYNIKKVEFDGLVYGQGGTVLEDDGNWWFTASGCTGDVGDTLIARYYDWDDQLVGIVEFVRK